jgi:hypothetical protein
MRNGQEQNNGQKRTPQTPLRQLAVRGSLALGGTAIAVAAVAGCSTPATSQSPADVVAADCNTLSTDLGGAVVALDQTQGGAAQLPRFATVPGANPPPDSTQLQVQAAQDTARLDLGIGLVPDSPGSSTNEKAATAEGNAANNAFDGMIDCDELTAVAINPSESAIAKAAAQGEVDNTLGADDLVAALEKEPTKFRDLRPEDRGAIVKANGLLHAASSVVNKLEGDLPGVGVKPPKKVRIKT